jgi:hypothetical protein
VGYMSFPFLRSTTTAVQNNNQAEQTISVPAGEPGDLLVIFIRNPVGEPLIAPANLTLLDSSPHDRGRQYLYAKITDGTEPSSYTFTIDGNTGRSTLIARRIANHGGWDRFHWYLDPEPGIADGAIQPPPLTAPWGVADNLWLTGFSHARTDRTFVDGPPNYGDLVMVHHPSTNSETRNRSANALRSLAADTEQPGEFDQLTDGGTVGVRSYTMVIGPKPRTKFLEDTFTAPDGTWLANHTPDMGASYTDTGSTVAVSTSNRGDGRIYANTWRQRSNLIRNETVPLSADYVAKVTFGFPPDADLNFLSSSSYWYVAVRLTPDVTGHANVDGYFFGQSGEAVAFRPLGIYRRKGGVVTLLAGSADHMLQYQWPEGGSINAELRVEGNNLQAWVNGELFLEYTDTVDPITQVGRVGASVGQSGATQPSYLDNLVAEALVEGDPVGPGGEWANLVESTGTGQQHHDTSTEPGRWYRYRVQVENPDGTVVSEWTGWQQIQALGGQNRLFAGATPVGALFVGSERVQKVYRGDILVEELEV